MVADLPGVYGGAAASNIVGEVRNIDNRAGQIELRTDSGRNFLVRYDDIPE